MKDNSTKYSPLVAGLRQSFEAHAAQGSRYLLVYWQGWGETTAYRPVESGQYPWAVHDAYMEEDCNASILALALDLKENFDAQMPEHMRQFKTFEAFAYKPLIHIPDRTGQVPAKQEKELLDKILKPQPQLRLVK